MLIRVLKLSALPTVAVVLLGGCATTAAPARLAYYRVPCSTPGALIAEPMVLDDPVVSAAKGQADTPSPPAQNAVSSRTCVVAVNDTRLSYQPGYGGYYDRPYYGSIGIGFGIGSRGHQFGGGHFGGHHGGHGRGH